MALSHENQQLVAKLVDVHERAVRGDREAVHFVKSLKTRALSGEEKARRIYNTLAVIHWRKRKGGDYDRAEAYYLRLKAKEPTAMAKLQVLLNRVRSGDQEALTLFRVLKSIHGKFKSSAFSDGPGAPRIGGYGLPQEHRPGIIIGAMPLVDCIQRGQEFSSHRPHIGHGGGFPMTQLPRYHGVLGQILYGNAFGTTVSGFSVGADVPVQPLTPQAVANLLSLMVRVRAMPLAAAVQSFVNDFRSQLASLPGQPATDFADGGTQGFTTTPQPTGFSTVQPPSGGAAQQTLGSMLQAVQTTFAPKAATAAEMQAFKAGITDPSTSMSMGQLVVNNNPFMQAVQRSGIAQGDPESLAGFTHGVITSLGNSVDGPGQQAFRDRMLHPLTDANSGLNQRRLYGFGVAQKMMYAATLSRTPIVLPAGGVTAARRVGTPMTDSQRAALLANQGICNSAAEALARGNPAAPGLIAQCSATRAANIAKGEYFADNLTPNDPAYRVALTNAGQVVINQNPQLAQFRASLPVSRQRGFTMAMGVRNGRMDPRFPAFVRPGLSPDPELLAGFELGMNMQ